MTSAWEESEGAPAQLGIPSTATGSSPPSDAADSGASSTPTSRELLDTMTDQGQSQSSIRQTRGLLTGVYRWAQQHGTTTDNPTLNTEWPWEPP